MKTPVREPAPLEAARAEIALRTVGRLRTQAGGKQGGEAFEIHAGNATAYRLRRDRLMRAEHDIVEPRAFSAARHETFVAHRIVDQRELLPAVDTQRQRHGET